ncbi:hypothetical protein ACQPYH_06815 [Kribbella sp. CA-245084]|uniref:hypothetical protein n=1 Tax=Kribbella sp. CA-245084 TaxID=3239940 RepID=UPI003D8B1D3B
MTNGDGLLLIGRTLYVVQNRSNQISVITLNKSGTRGTVVDQLTSPSTPYWVTAVSRSRVR